MNLLTTTVRYLVYTAGLRIRISILFGTWIRIQIRIEVKSWIRIRIKVKIHKFQRLKIEPLRAMGAYNRSLEGQTWSPGGSVNQ
jgi:hypothetical protein